MRPGFDPWVGKIPWRRELLPTPVLWPGKFHGWRSLVGYSPWDRRVRHDCADSLVPVFLPGESHGQKKLPWSSSLWCRIHSFPPSCGAACVAADISWRSLSAQGCPLFPPRGPLHRPFGTLRASFQRPSLLRWTSS